MVDLGWGFNAQTHVEVDRSEWWESNRPSVSVLHFTEKKGWQCEERHEPPKMSQDCRKDKSTPLCFGREAHLYRNALAKGKAAVDEAMANNRQKYPEYPFSSVG